LGKDEGIFCKTGEKLLMLYKEPYENIPQITESLILVRLFGAILELTTIHTFK